MDICRPPVQWIDGRCYRRQEEVEYKVETGYTGEECDELGEDEEGLQHEIVEVQGGRYRAALQIAEPFYGFIIGKGGEGKRRLEAETKTRVQVPKKGQQGEVIVEGRSRSGVASAASRLDVIVASARARQPFTHFLSIPLNTPALQEAFLKFRDEVIRDAPNCRGMHETLFQNPTLLHLTLGTMALLDDRERQLARDILEDCSHLVLRPLLGQGDLEVSIEGLEYMNDDPGEVDVLYAKVQEHSGRLQEAVDKVVERFVASGLMKQEYDRVKLHCTLINSLFRKEEEDESDGGTEGERRTFDAKPLLENWGQLCLGQVAVNEVHLSVRRAGRKTAKTGYYMPSHIVRLKEVQ